MDDNDESLDYVSSVDPFAPEAEPASPDVEDEKALDRVSKALAKQKALYVTIDGMKMFDTTKFNADQREAMCNKIVELIGSLEKSVNNAINGIKEKQYHGPKR